MSAKLAPKDGEQAAAFLKSQHDQGKKWNQACLMLQRTARGIPPVYPTAASAMHSTPVNERVSRITDLRRGMVAYSDDPNDSNKAGHIYFVAGWDGKTKDPKGENCLVWTNVVGGSVQLVRLTFFLANWGDPFQFGATWLNGYDFSDFNAAPKPAVPAKPKASLGDVYVHAMNDLKKSIAYHRAHHHPRLVRQLENDLAQMEKTYAAWRKK